MTLIIGSRCIDDVVIAGDRKIVDSEYDDVDESEIY